jgi:uncharacterized membrane protein
MNLKRTFGAILTVLGIIGLIYAAYQLIGSGQKQWLSSLIIFIVGGIFFSSGINLIKGTKDES